MEVWKKDTSKLLIGAILWVKSVVYGGISLRMNFGIWRNMDGFSKE